MKHLKLELTEELHKALKVYAAESGQTMQAISVQAIEKYLREKGKIEDEKRSG